MRCFDTKMIIKKISVLALFSILAFSSAGCEEEYYIKDASDLQPVNSESGKNTDEQKKTDSESSSKSSDSFDSYLKANDRDTYDRFKDLKNNYNINNSYSNSDDSFEDYLRKNDKDSYDYYKDLQKGYDNERE